MQVAPSVHALRHPFRVPAAPGIALERFVYSYLVFGETITLIDTGVAGGEVQIFDAIRSSGRDPSEIALIILTHSHPDHIGGARAIQRATSCSIAAHPPSGDGSKTWNSRTASGRSRGLPRSSVDRCRLTTNSWTGIQ